MEVQLLSQAIPDVLTPIEASKILHIGRSTMYHLLAQGEIKSFKIKTKILIPKSFLQDFIANRLESSMMVIFRWQRICPVAGKEKTYECNRKSACKKRHLADGF